MKLLSCFLSFLLAVSLWVITITTTTTAFVIVDVRRRTTSTISTTTTNNNNKRLYFFGQGSGKDRLDEEWDKQQEILKNRRLPKKERDEYFNKIEQSRAEASLKQKQMWSWQTKKYDIGEDPIDEWRKKRNDGSISDLNDQYGDPKKIGGIPLPMASFGVGGEFGVGGKFDNGGRFDLRLPYAEQGYVDEESDVMGKLVNFFGGGGNKNNNNKNKKEKEELKQQQQPPKISTTKDPSLEEKQSKKKGGWPW